MGVYSVCMLILHNNCSMVSFYDYLQEWKLQIYFFHVETKFISLFKYA
jgi:hypothetical protein